MAEIPPSHAEQIADQLDALYRGGEFESADEAKSAFVALIDAGLHAALGSYTHELSLIEADTKRGITDCSTPLFQRVRNIVEQLEAAEAHAAALADRLTRLEKKIEEWAQEENRDMQTWSLEHSGHSQAAAAFARERYRTLRRIAALLALPQDGEAR